MESQPAISWSEQLHETTLITAPSEDEFSNFLEFNMHFADLEGHGPAHSHLQDQQHPLGPPPPTTTATTAPESAHPQYSGAMEGLAMDFTGQDPVPSQQPGPIPYSTPNMTPGFCAQDASHQPMMAHQQSQPGQSHYIQSQAMIPPTPNSMELHGNASRYPQRIDENSEMYDRYSRINEEQVCSFPSRPSSLPPPPPHRDRIPSSKGATLPHLIRMDTDFPFFFSLAQALYTPLVSPAMTPLENQFRLPEYTIPGEYFTPLTSPALEAQNASSSGNGYPYHSRQVSDVGFVPTSAEINPLSGISAPGSPSIIRKSRRRPSVASSRLAGRTNKPRQSPHIRAQTQSQHNRGKHVALNSEEFYSSLTQELNKPRNHDVRSLQVSSNEGSGQDSVSPEPLPDSLMPPPAIPPPRKSPAITPQAAQSPGTAATPATLMRIQRSQHVQEGSPSFTDRPQLEYHDEVMEDISLPEAAAPVVQLRPNLARIDTSMRTDTASPIISANVTPSLEPRSTAADRTPGSVAFSPRTVAMPSPSGPVPKRSDPSRSSISSRKRPSLSSTQASPQLRPKISPSIQPMMRGGDSEFDIFPMLKEWDPTDQHTNVIFFDLIDMSQDALYLASKSNYQHILDGTLPSGVSYPETLAENLSSKRTNHKLAEQGRRNRINSALKEIESLIPPEFIQARQAKEAALANSAKPGDKEKEKEKEKPANQAISKASAVEMAIDYIKALKMTLNDTASKLAAAEAKLAGVHLDDEKSTEKAEVPGLSEKTTNNMTLGAGHSS
ncbi:hypothetical protein N7462_000277 [Penicillium macrosclerotiorum]|uniref:uncharacterized protein n=1 Tax=Penicillium macrosclerotiorum TaxID=303699 RepID=UPI002548049F|nr:uncharacterized protein N7462_000277 [Penicillium macrosclerotiorum]KAJ5698272.1 hypothetical protein N7462_000277 [Penicillium macrosclerotiorum]